jgi:hypothetical protein
MEVLSHGNGRQDGLITGSTDGVGRYVAANLPRPAQKS